MNCFQSPVSLRFSSSGKKEPVLHACVAFENLFWLSHDVAQLWSFKKLSPTSSQVPLRKVQLNPLLQLL